MSDSSSNATDTTIRRVLEQARVIALTGASNNPARPSYGVMEFLMARGYRVIPINPGLAGGELLGQTVYGSLADVPGPVDMLDIFRNSAAAGNAIEEALAHKARLGLSSIWMQIGVMNETAATAARAAGLDVVMDRCPKIEIRNLGIATPRA